MAQKLLGKAKELDKALGNIKQNSPEMPENRHQIDTFFQSQRYHCVL